MWFTWLAAFHFLGFSLNFHITTKNNRLLM